MNQAQIPILRSKGLSSVCFESRVVCKFERDTSKDNHSFATLSFAKSLQINP